MKKIRPLLPGSGPRARPVVDGFARYTCVTIRIRCRTAAHTVYRESAVEHTYRPDFERFRDVRAPTLLLGGSESPPFLADPIGMLEKVIPRARVSVMQGQAHNAIDVDPNLFIREVVGFLRDVAAGG